MSKWLRKADKRKIKEQDKGILDFAKSANHYFKNLREWINEMIDPRHQSYITY